MRTIVDIPEDQIKALAEISDQSNLSRAELIRRALAEYLKKRASYNEDAFGLWKNRNLEGLDYQQQLRKEWPD